LIDDVWLTLTVFGDVSLHLSVIELLALALLQLLRLKLQRDVSLLLSGIELLALAQLQLLWLPYCFLMITPTIATTYYY